MISKVKELMEVKENIDTLSKSVSDLSKEFNKYKEDVCDIKPTIEETTAENKRILKQMQNEIESFSGFKKSLEKELYDFKLFKKELRDNVNESLKKELSDVKELLKKEVGEFNALKKSLNSKTTDIEKLEAEIRKLTDIAKNIKTTDFQLQKHASNLNKKDDEIRALNNKISSLQRLVANMRRKQDRRPIRVPQKPHAQKSSKPAESKKQVTQPDESRSQFSK